MDIPKRIKKSLGISSGKAEQRLKRGNFKYRLTYVGDSWCIDVETSEENSEKTYWKMRDLLLPNELVLEKNPIGLWTLYERVYDKRTVGVDQ